MKRSLTYLYRQTAWEKSQFVGNSYQWFCFVLKEARAKESSAASIWLVIANTYESISDILISFALWRYGTPSQWIQIVKSYYIILIKAFQN